MNQEEIEDIIKKLETQNLKEKATFGIFQYGGGSDESYIEANKEGLVCYAIELLKSVSKIDKIEVLDRQEVLFSDEDWIDEQSDTIVHHIKSVEKRNRVKQEAKHTNKYIDKLWQVGCILAFILIVVIFVIGSFSLVKWIFF